MRNEGTTIAIGTAGIALNATESDPVEVQGASRGGFVMPAAMTGTAMTFKVSHDGTTYKALYNSSNTLISITVAVDRAYPLPSEIFGFAYFKFVSGSTELAAREIALNAKY